MPLCMKRGKILFRCYYDISQSGYWQILHGILIKQDQLNSVIPKLHALWNDHSTACNLQHYFITSNLQHWGKIKVWLKKRKFYWYLLKAVCHQVSWIMSNAVRQLINTTYFWTIIIKSVLVILRKHESKTKCPLSIATFYQH